ncbi:MAG: HAD family phosphatase [Anaerolineae bacterium]|nr:HAD family phosphatase [Anaerolineae bacterium]
MTSPSTPPPSGTEKELVLCFDMDGTILDQHERFYPQDVPILHSPPPHVQLLLATGRSLPSVLLTCVKNGLIEAGQQLPFPVVCQNGGVNYLPGGVTLNMQSIEPALVDEIIRQIDPYWEVTILFFLIEDILAYRVTPYGEKALALYDLDPKPMPANLRDQPVTKVMLISQDPAPLASLYQDGADLPLERTYSFDTILEFGPRGVHKAAGIASLLDALGLSHLPLYVAGDGMNDLTMLKAATRAFVPDTGSQPARQLAHVILPVRQHGLLAPILADWQRDHRG